MLILKASSGEKPATGIVCHSAYLQDSGFTLRLPPNSERSRARRTVKLPSRCLRSLLNAITGNNTNKSK